MKKRYLVLLGLIGIILSCNQREEEIEVTSVSITQSAIEMIIGESFQLEATVSPSNAADKTVTWSSANTSIAKVSSSGLVTAVTKGTTTVTASAGRKSSTCQITVNNNVVAVTSVQLDQTELTMEKGQSVILKATVMPDDATERSIQWKSLDETVVSVDANGKVTAVAGGSTRVIAKAGDIEAVCSVTVIVPVQQISLDRETLSLEVGSSATLVAQIKPDDATDKTVSWSSSNAQIATVDEKGMVTALSQGEATITASAGGKSAVCSVVASEKYVAVISITLNEAELSLVKGQSETLTAIVKPDDATDKTVTWSSSNPEIVTVDQSGKVEAVSGGKATISAKAGEKYSACDIIVTVPVASVTLDQQEMTLEEGQEGLLKVTISPDDATEKAVTWSTSDPNIATVGDGKVTGIKEGTATITARAGGKEASCQVSVKHNPDNDPILFADSSIKEKLVTAFDSNDDGEISYKEAAAVTSLNGVFGNQKNFTSFDEFQYFTGVTQIENEQFYGWDLESIVLPKSIEKIGLGYNSSDVFRDCIFLTSTVIPEGVYYIGGSAFRGCTSLKSIALPNSVTHVGLMLFAGCTALSTVTLPKGLARIENLMFENCSSLSSVTVPEGVTEIGEWAFMCCGSLESLSLPSSINKIESGAFYKCHQLASINIPDAVSIIGSNAFYECKSITSVTIPNGITRLESEVFRGCAKLESIQMPASIKHIGEYAFMGCKALTSIHIPDGVKSIEPYTFSGCKSLNSVTIPKTVSSIGSSAFFLCASLSFVEIPESVTDIMSYAFSSCANLSSITLPEGLTTIGESAFNSCSQLSSVTVLASTVPMGAPDMFANTNNCPIYVPAESVETYKGADYWSVYADRLQVMTTPKAIDLGLSVKWASFNIGATRPEEFGDYYAWGETETKTDYSFSTYKWIKFVDDYFYGKKDYFLKYNGDGEWGDVDNKSVLDPEDDVAHVKYGGNWRIPTDAEWEELITRCTKSWIKINGFEGCKFSGPNGNSIFLPFAGRAVGTDLENVIIYPEIVADGHYWSSTLKNIGYPGIAYDRHFVYSAKGIDIWRSESYANRAHGYSVRPVTK